MRYKPTQSYALIANDDGAAMFGVDKLRAREFQKDYRWQKSSVYSQYFNLRRADNIH